MVKLDYQTNNPRWGWSGMEFTDWSSYVLTIGFLSNIRHFKGFGQSQTIWDNSISIHIESNEQQGAWNKEGRIHYYGKISNLEKHLPDLHMCSSAGNDSISCRINSNSFVYSLITDLGFVPNIPLGYLTANVMPPQNAQNSIPLVLQRILSDQNISIAKINSCLNNFTVGWNL